MIVADLLRKMTEVLMMRMMGMMNMLMLSY